MSGRRGTGLRRATGLSRRGVLATGGGAVVSALLFPARRRAHAQITEVHGLSAFGDLKYPPTFPYLDYVNPDAPKGGTFSMIPSTRAYNQSYQTFNSLNAYVLKGDGAQGMQLTFASLMARATDEPDAMYGLAARAVRISPDRLTYEFILRREAAFHDGSRMSARDVVFSLEILKAKGHPIIQQLLRDMAGVKALDEETVAVTFAARRGRDVPLYVASLPIFSRVYYAERAFEESSLAVPLGSGPYRVGRFEVGRYIEFERVKDWWGANLPIQRGQNNFDVLRYEFYRDREVAFEGFTARNYLFREEFTSRVWATRYDFAAVRDGRVRRETLPDDTPSGAQGWFINMRRPKFRDSRMREALGCAFDFEWTNKTIMYGAYKRTHSPFQNSDMMAMGPPDARERALLEPLRGKIAEEAFGEPFVPPVSDGNGQDRTLLRRAAKLLAEAGCTINNGKLHTPDGEAMTIEFLLDEPTIQPHHMPFIKNLGTLGIAATLRIVDPVQYRARLDDFDFDMTIVRFSMSSTPGDALRTFFSSQAAKTRGSQNLAGIADPAIDALIEAIVAAEDRDSLTVACRAFDRVFRAGRYWIPQWYKGTHQLAFWDVFGHPATKPRYARGAPETWWHDQDKAARIERAG